MNAPFVRTVTVVATEPLAACSYCGSPHYHRTVLIKGGSDHSPLYQCERCLGEAFLTFVAAVCGDEHPDCRLSAADRDETVRVLRRLTDQLARIPRSRLKPRGVIRKIESLKGR